MKRCGPLGHRENVHLEIVKVLVVVLTRVLFELDFSIVVTSAFADIFVDLCRCWNFSVLDEITSFVGCVFLDDVGLFVLEFTQRQEDDVAVVDPDLLRQEGRMGSVHHLARDAFTTATHLLPHLSTDQSKTLLAVETLSLQAPVAEHAENLCVLWVCNDERCGLSAFGADICKSSQK